MKKYVFSALLMGAALFSNAQIQDEKSVTMTLDLQPVLQLNMETPDQVEFVFDDINDYYSGITQYGATILKVSSTVSWDLYAVGRSNGSTAADYWDQQIDYGSDNTNAIDQIPISALEIHQSRANSGAGAATGAFTDYSQAFSSLASGAVVAAPNGGNSVFFNTGGGLTPPGLTEKYIAGHSGATGTGDFMPGGSYLTQTGTESDYYYVIDYRILPSLPAIFPNAFEADGTTAKDIVSENAAGNYAEPGVYTMYVQYILLEDQ